MEVVSVSYAKAHFSALLSRVEQGEEFAITKRGKVVAKLVPVRTAAQTLERVWAMGGLDLPDNLSASSKATPGPMAARSQDVLYGDDGLPA